MLVRQQKETVDALCDLGAGDGEVTRLVANHVNPKSISVVEIDPANAARLRDKGFTVYSGDLNSRLGLDVSFDVVIANQVIEHLYDTDLFLSEVFRITRPGGAAVISTENLASWHNVLSLLFGWQPFSLTNVSGIASGIGNPFALHAGEDGACFEMQHHRLFTARALRELMVAHGFVDVRVAGSGYYPLPPQFGRIDPNHAHFITAIGSRPVVS